MTISELQTLIVYAVTTGLFLGFIIGVLLSVFGKHNNGR